MALIRDLNERRWLAEVARKALAETAPAPVITFTDGPMELWGAKDTQDSQDFQRSLDEYQQVLVTLQELGATTAGYVDKPAANLVVRLLEVAIAERGAAAAGEAALPAARRTRPDLFRRLLAPGERSAVFAIQSRSATHYLRRAGAALLLPECGRAGRSLAGAGRNPRLGSREQPRCWTNLHAVLVQQCRVMGNRPYPYLTAPRARGGGGLPGGEGAGHADDPVGTAPAWGGGGGDILQTIRQRSGQAGHNTKGSCCMKDDCSEIRSDDCYAPAPPDSWSAAMSHNWKALPSGALVRAPLEDDYQIYGLIHDIHIDDDGLVRQLVTADGIDENIIADNRMNRNVPLEMSVLAVGYSQGGRIYHLLPPRPPLSLDVIYLCNPEELCQFTSRALRVLPPYCAPATCRSASCWRRTSSKRRRTCRAAIPIGPTAPCRS